MFSRKPTVPKQTAADALDDMACAEKFARQVALPRWFKRTAVVSVLGLLVTAVFASLQGGLWTEARSLLGYVALGHLLYGVVRFGESATCPRCGRNVQNCPPSHCHRCRLPLSNERCGSCEVDFSLSGRILGLSGSAGNQLPIRYCPGCGAYVNSDFTWAAESSD
ncbi:MAG: hypothetical protein RL514_2502 [Verrucomicrobiota bacterium]|jgi:hypothetical protein